MIHILFLNYNIQQIIFSSRIKNRGVSVHILKVSTCSNITVGCFLRLWLLSWHFFSSLGDFSTFALHLFSLGIFNHLPSMWTLTSLFAWPFQRLGLLSSLGIFVFFAFIHFFSFLAFLHLAISFVYSPGQCHLLTLLGDFGYLHCLVTFFP